MSVNSGTNSTVFARMGGEIGKIKAIKNRNVVLYCFFNSK
ncbi:hypothetical protein IKE_05872 [Bacillus cereus VD196]|uniref:Uncharacterized protein n=1 Tax=Bacillus cereus VD196 TaxID=1053243 RepID=A0A9W5PYF9_BACCE|nr:hypothetical protein IKE_05872 [Bacillus cereus VD196]